MVITVLCFLVGFSFLNIVFILAYLNHLNKRIRFLDEKTTNEKANLVESIQDTNKTIKETKLLFETSSEYRDFSKIENAYTKNIKDLGLIIDSEIKKIKEQIVSDKKKLNAELAECFGIAENIKTFKEFEKDKLPIPEWILKLRKGVDNNKMVVLFPETNENYEVGGTITGRVYDNDKLFDYIKEPYVPLIRKIDNKTVAWFSSRDKKFAKILPYQD